MDDIEEFDRYNEELKKYLIANLRELELMERVKGIPKVLEESNGHVVATGVLSAFFCDGCIRGCNLFSGKMSH